MIKAFKDIIFKFGEYFKNSFSIDCSREKAKESLRNNDWESFLKFYRKDDLELSYDKISKILTENDNVELFKKLESLIEKEGRKCDYNYFKFKNYAIKNDSIEIFKQIISQSNIVIDEKLFLKAVQAESIKIIKHLLFNVKFRPSKELRYWIVNDMNKSLFWERLSVKPFSEINSKFSEELIALIDYAELNNLVNIDNKKQKNIKL